MAARARRRAVWHSPTSGWSWLGWPHICIYLECFVDTEWGERGRPARGGRGFGEWDVAWVHDA
jgi:hypothetical protein